MVTRSALTRLLIGLIKALNAARQACAASALGWGRGTWQGTANPPSLGRRQGNGTAAARLRDQTFSSATTHCLASTLHLAWAGRHGTFGHGHRRAQRIQGSEPLLDVGDLMSLECFGHFADMVGELIQRYLPFLVAHDHRVDRDSIRHPLMLLDFAREELSHSTGLTFADEYQPTRPKCAVDDIEVPIGRNGRSGYPLLGQHS